MKINVIFPKKTIRLAVNFDKPFITAEIKKLDRLKKREYRKHHRSKKYLELKGKFDEKYKCAAEAHLEKSVRSLKEDDPGKAYASLKKMGSQPGDCSESGSFTLLSHLEQNLSIAESTERIAQHFANISQEYPPFNPELLPADVKSKISQPVNPTELPVLAEHDVYEKI